MKWSWFAVKTIYRIEAHGRPVMVDSAYAPDATLIEERIVLFRVRSLNEAIRKAEKEAELYIADSYLNPYGQEVKMRYLGACDAFHLVDLPESRTEVYSATEIISKQVKDQEVIDRKLGKVRDGNDRQQRMKFLNQEFSGLLKKAI